MSECERDDCGGTVLATGFCDTCGRRPRQSTVPPPVTSLPSSATTSTSATSVVSAGPFAATTTRRTRSGGPWLTGGLVSLPMVERPDPASRILSDPRVPEGSRICGHCKAEVGRSHAPAQPALAEGYCSQCTTPFCFTPKLSEGDLVAGRYSVLGCVARGGLGWIYLAKDNHFEGDYVALKGLINTNDQQARKLAIDERRFLKLLDHPNIVHILDFVDHHDPLSDELTSYIVMDYVGGLSLREIKARAGSDRDPLDDPLLVEHVIAYGREILGALDYLHGEGLLFCDMKPDNVIHGEKRIKLIDLGAVRKIGDRRSVVVGTPRYQVTAEEIREHGLTVRADIHTVGVTLDELFQASAAWPAGIEFGIESFRRVCKRATANFERRFGTAAEMSDQLASVLREIHSLRDGIPRPARSAVFAEAVALLDAGLGQVPPLDHWTTVGAAGADEREVVLGDGRPSAHAVAAGLPVPLVDPDDPAASFLAAVRATDARRLVDKLATFETDSVEIRLAECRARIELADLGGAERCLASGGEVLDALAPYDWRMAWHRGLLALAKDDVTAAATAFDEVYGALPGEDAPKLALGFCAEYLGSPDWAERCYEAVWRRDRSQVSAAFGLARIRLSQADRAGAVGILDEVPEVSRHYDAAMIAAVRVLFGRLPAGRSPDDGLPTAGDFSKAVDRLPTLYLDIGDKHGETRDRLFAAIRESALARVRGLGRDETGGHLALDGGALLGDPPTEDGLRALLERSFRRLARQARNADDHGVLIDRANAIRPKTLR